MFFFTPRYLKEAKHYLQGAKKILAYKRDILAPSRVSEIEKGIEELRSAMRRRDREDVSKSMRHIDDLIGKSVPPVKNAGLRENIEVLVVAIVFAAGVKAYFLQPFRIPTGSMQPTASSECPPNSHRRICSFAPSTCSSAAVTTSTSARKRKMSL